MVGRYCSYLLPKQGGGTFQIQVNKTQSTRTWDALYGRELKAKYVPELSNWGVGTCF